MAALAILVRSIASPRLSAQARQAAFYGRKEEILMKTLGTAAVLALLLAAPAVAAENLVQIGQSEQRGTTLAADENIGTSIETLLRVVGSLPVTRRPIS